MRRFAHKLELALAGLVAGFAFACGNPAPREVPPLAPRPDPMPPSPSGPVPGAPDPIPPPVPRPTVPPADAGTPPPPPTTHVQPQFLSAIESPGAAGARSDAERRGAAIDPPSDAAPAQTADAGVDAELPPLPDGGLPPDASKQPE
jgi:hypothetical protein